MCYPLRGTPHTDMSVLYFLFEYSVWDPPLGSVTSSHMYGVIWGVLLSMYGGSILVGTILVGMSPPRVYIRYGSPKGR